MGFTKKQRWSQNIRPAMRGSRRQTAVHDVDHMLPAVPYGEMVKLGSRYIWRYFFEECPFYLSYLIVTSMPYLDDGKWILKYEEDPKAFYIESTAYDNVDVLGEEYIQNLKEDLDDMEFRIEVMNERVEQLPDGFYANLNEDKHVSLKEYYQSTTELMVSFDFGNFNSMTVYQEHGDVLAGLDAIYVKRGTVQELVDKFIDRYKHHKQKFVDVYGDRNGNNSQPNSKKTLYQEIDERLRHAGWKVRLNVRGLDPPHADKHLLINAALKEEEGMQLPKIRLHAIRCRNLIISMKKSPIRENMKKDKRSEHPKSKLPQEYATHFSDTFDNLYYPRYRNLFRAGKRARFLSI